ncbi:MAG: AmmeMemoRadiSam system protein B [Candidatus Marinimicrobia bacterium]|nr:AmmeMemoRadiSam system protein B [Candidatus Neomarinimicrobiota bacterium]
MSYRKPEVAGQFYPRDPETLRRTLDGLFERAERDYQPETGTIAGLVSPHAGYVFSGYQAAKAYQYLNGRRYALVCVISPSHREYFRGISVYHGEGYRTPLGDCPVHGEAREIAKTCKGILLSAAGHREEHALEVQVPFIQYMLGDIPLLPLVMGDQGADTLRDGEACVRALSRAFGDAILFVASTDLSHFHPADRACEMDGRFIRLLAQGDDEAIVRELRTGKVEACGAGPVLSILRGLGSARHRVRPLGYSHSGQVLNDDGSVVGYTSALILKHDTQPEKD